MKTQTSFPKIGSLAAFSAVTLGSVALLFATPQLAPENDIEVAEFLQMELYHDAAMGGAEVTIEIEDGIATITGTAKSLAQVERATAKAFANPEVLTVVNQMDISGASPEIMLANAKKTLMKQNIISAESISLSTNGSRLVISGTVSTVDEGELAREILSEIPGVMAIDNQLTISFQSIRTDAQIANQLKFSVNDDPIFYGLDLAAQVSDGVVTWNGDVGSRQEFNRLIRKSYVTGVFEVKSNDLHVNGDLRMEAVEDKDYTASQCVEAFTVAIQHDSRIDENAVDAEMADGVMILSGTVGDTFVADSLLRTARGIPGVLRVSNQVQIADKQQFASRSKDLKSVSPKTISRPER